MIKVEKQTKYVEELFNDLEFKGVFGKAQLAVFKVVYKSKLNGLYNLIRRKVSKWICNETENYFDTSESGSLEYLTVQREEFSKFMLGTEEQLKNEKEYGKFKNDRIVLKVMRYFSGKASSGKDKFIKGALGDGTVMQFFNMCGISITWRIVED